MSIRLYKGEVNGKCNLCIHIKKYNKAMDLRTLTLWIFVHLSKAFDRECHNLLTKFQLYGIRGTAFSLLKSYLSNRKQQVCIDGVISETRNISYGVAQGTVLEPLRFNYLFSRFRFLKGFLDVSHLYKTLTFLWYLRLHKWLSVGKCQCLTKMDYTNHVWQISY